MVIEGIHHANYHYKQWDERKNGNNEWDRARMKVYSLSVITVKHISLNQSINSCQMYVCASVWEI